VALAAPESKYIVEIGSQLECNIYWSLRWAFQGCNMSIISKFNKRKLEIGLIARPLGPQSL
jgi:hypothetical protein